MQLMKHIVFLNGGMISGLNTGGSGLSLIQSAGSPIIALTATATPKVQHDIQKNLES
jgi:hypothetical protein